MAALVKESAEEPAEARHERADAEQGSDQGADQEEERLWWYAPDPALGLRVPPVGNDGFREEVIGASLWCGPRCRGVGLHTYRRQPLRCCDRIVRSSTGSP